MFDPDVTLGKTNEGHSGTEIQAQSDFNQDYVFQGNARTGPGGKIIDGLRGLGSDFGGTGVFGQAIAIGVNGSAGNIGVSGQSISHDFSANVSGIGVLGSSDRNRAGVFSGGGLLHSPDIQETLNSSETDPRMHPAQLRLVPYDDKPVLPKKGLAGDFFVVMGRADSDSPVVIWFCIESHGANPAVWVPIALNMATRRNGGDPALLP